MQQALHSGLTQLASDVPVRQGYVELDAGVSQVGGAFVQAEAGYRITESLGLFSQAEWTSSDLTAGLGVRWSF